MQPPSERAPARPIDPGALALYGWDAALATTFDPFLAEPGALPGRVTRVDRGSSLVATPLGEMPCHLPRGTPPADAERDGPATGDWVTVRAVAAGGFVIDAILPRRSVIRRRDAHLPTAQVVVANVDVVLVVHGLDRPPKLRRMERALVMAWESGATPVIVLSKADLVAGGAAGPQARVAIDLLQEVSSGADVVVTSAATGAGLDELTDLLPVGATVALIGESGAGKSTLVNRLLGEDRQDTGETSWVRARGKHTTTARELIPLPGGAVLVDTPGLRKLGLWESGDGMQRAFADIESLAAECRFRDCAHDAEPGCAVAAAVTAGGLDAKRLAGYRKLERELEFLEADLRTRRARAKEKGRRMTRYHRRRDAW